MPAGAHDSARLAAIVFVVFHSALSACFVEPAADMASVEIRIPFARSSLALNGELPGPRGDDDLVRLGDVPVFLQVWVTGPGIEEPVTAAWPETSGTQAPESIVLELEVPAGSSRRFEFVAYVYEGGEIRTWTDDGSIVRDLAGGTSSRLEVTLDRANTGTLAGTIVGPAAELVRQVRAVDGDPEAGIADGPGVAYPTVSVTDNSFELTDVPLGRPLSFRLTMETGDEAVSPTPPVVLSVPGENLEIAVEAP